MTSPIRILYIIDFLHGYSGGGTERHLLQLTNLLDRKKFLPTIVGFDVGDTPLTRVLRDAGVGVVSFPVGRYYTPRAIQRTHALAALIRGQKPDIVQTFHFKSDLLGAIAARAADVPWIISSRRDMGDNKKPWQRLLNRGANRFFHGFIAVCDAVGEALAVREGVRPERITRIYNGVDAIRYSPADVATRGILRADLGLSPEDFVVGMVAVFRPEKDYKVFFEAIRRLHMSIPRLKAIAVGSGPTLEAQRNWCRDAGLEGIVIFPGAVQNVEKYLQMFDVACFVPSQNEGFSNALLEKMSMGLPVVATDVGGNREAVVNSFNGVLIPPGDSRRLEEALLFLYQRPDLRKEMGQRSRHRVETLFTLERMITAHAAFYSDLARGAEGANSPSHPPSRNGLNG